MACGSELFSASSGKADDATGYRSKCEGFMETLINTISLTIFSRDLAGDRSGHVQAHRSELDPRMRQLAKGPSRNKRVIRGMMIW